MALNKEQTLNLIKASKLLARHCGVLSDFELETVAELGARLMRDGVFWTSITAEENRVLEDAVGAMEAAETKGCRRTAA